MHGSKAASDALAALAAPVDGWNADAASAHGTPSVPTLAAERELAPVSPVDSSVGRSVSEVLHVVSSEHTAADEQPPPNHQNRIPVEDKVFDAVAPGPGRRSSRHINGLGQPVLPTEQPTAIPPIQILIERFLKLFLSGENGPVATADGGVAREATIELVLAVRDAVAALWMVHEAEIKRRCAPSMPCGVI